MALVLLYVDDMITASNSKQQSSKRRKMETNDCDGENKEEKKVPYREAIGSLMYLANATRPDICYAVNYLAKMQQAPTEED